MKDVVRYLQEQGLPKDEMTYPEELLPQIIIKAFEELQDQLEELQDQIKDNDMVPVEDLWDVERHQQYLERELTLCQGALEKCQAELKDRDDRIEAVLAAFNRMRRYSK